MKTYNNPSPAMWPELCLRPSSDNTGLEARVTAIIEQVRLQGDNAIRALSKQIDRQQMSRIAVTAEEIEEACSQVSDDVKQAISSAASNIRSFHEAQKPSEVDIETIPGVRCIQRPVPIERVGLYIPGGTAPLFSTVLMLAIPATIAGCREIVLCTPASHEGKVNNEVLYAASYCGVKQIFKVGGAQAIAAMAYGTETVPKVDKIFGPGNQYVTTAKQLLSSRTVAVDMPAGPSEVMVIADAATPPQFAAADLLSQAEHGPDSQVMLLCDTSETADNILRELQSQLQSIPRSEFAFESLGNSRCLIISNPEDQIAFANMYAPEHLIIESSQPWEIASGITAAGSVFVGKWTPESAGDYASGTNHTLPTCGWARSFSGINLDSFYRKMTIQELSFEGLQNLEKTIVTMAEAEGLQAHASAVRIRTSYDQK